jgi:hypothetical protein
MARAKRHYLHGHVWHITHRCHKKEFLLKLVKDRQRWLYWLFKAKKRLGIRSKGRKILEDEDDYQLRDRQTGYGDRAQFNSENLFYWGLDNKPANPHIP